MEYSELLIRITIWIALAGYGLGAAYLLAGRRPAWESRARWAWTMGACFLLIHVGLAFHFKHQWSQASAYAETARQTAEVFGPNWGGGLYVNYALMLAWLADLLWWWQAPESFRRRPRPLHLAWHGFLIFIFFNATVVFVGGLLRWLGLILCAGLTVLWAMRLRDPNRKVN